MAEETLSPKNWIGKKKDGEVFRLQLFMAEKDLKPEDIQRDTGISVRTITNSIYENNPLGMKILRAIHANYGVSIDWLISGVGSMLIEKTTHIGEGSPPEYESGKSIDRNKRDQRLLSFISEWLTYAEDDEKAWLEMELKFNLTAYRRYLDGSDD